jgi:hypothetical protein
MTTVWVVYDNNFKEFWCGKSDWRAELSKAERFTSLDEARAEAAKVYPDSCYGFAFFGVHDFQ